MSITLQRELEQIEADIKQSILDGDNFAYQKHLRRKQETADKLFFSETASLREQVESLTSERQAAIGRKSELETALKEAADVVLIRRNALYEAEMEYQRIGNFIFYSETQIEQRRKDISDLRRKFDAHIQSKLNSGGSPTMETLTNESTY